MLWKEKACFVIPAASFLTKSELVPIWSCFSRKVNKFKYKWDKSASIISVVNTEQCCPEAAPLRQSHIFSHYGPLKMHSLELSQEVNQKLCFSWQTSVKTLAVKKSHKIPRFLSGPLC